MTNTQQVENKTIKSFENVKRDIEKLEGEIFFLKIMTIILMVIMGLLSAYTFTFT